MCLRTILLTVDCYNGARYLTGYLNPRPDGRIRLGFNCNKVRCPKDAESCRGVNRVVKSQVFRESYTANINCSANFDIGFPRTLATSPVLLVALQVTTAAVW